MNWTRIKRLTERKWLKIGAAALGIALILSFGGLQVVAPQATAPEIDGLQVGFGNKVLTIGPEKVYAAGVADYSCDGVNDDVQFQAALDALPAGGGKLVVLAGDYVFGATVLRAIDNVTIQGVGRSSYIAWNGAGSLFDAGVQNNWVFRDIRFDAGGVDVVTATDWSFENVYIGATYYAYRVDAAITADEFAVPTGRGATVVVAASNSLASSQAQADYVCDGTADDVEIQAAIDALPVTGGKVLLLDGTYHIAATINLNDYSIFLQGQTMYKGNGTAGLWMDNGVNADMLYVTGHKCQIRDLFLDGNKANNASGHCLHTSGGWLDLHAENLFIFNAAEDGVLIDSGGTTLIGINSEFSADRNFHLLNHDWQRLTNCVGTDNDSGASIWIENCSRVHLVGCGVDEAPYGLSISTSEDVMVVAIMIEGVGHDGIRIEGSQRVTIADSIIKNIGKDTNNTYDGIHMQTSGGIHCIENIIVGNRVYSVEANKPRYGVCENDANQNYNVIKNNVLTDCQTATICIQGEATVSIDNEPAPPTDNRNVVYMKNTSGGNLVAGDVVSYKAVAAGDEFTNPAAGGEDQVLGMLTEDINNNASGYVKILGKTIILKATNAVGGAIAIGDFLCTEAGNRAMKAGAGDMAFAIALEACNAADCTIDALLIVPRKI